MSLAELSAGLDRVGSVSDRVVAVLTHPRRPEAMAAACDFVASMARHDIRCLVFPEALEVIRETVPEATLAAVGGENDPYAEIAVVFGGDGTILRAAEWAVAHDVPVLGVNLGHVGFLAEMEVVELPALADRVLRADYTTERRVTLAVEALDESGRRLWSSFAVNEVSLEKASRQKVVEILATIDGLPVSRWACDGILISTPTGSTAYAFSAGGPVIWPNVEAFLVVPLSAHALFARPLVVGPDSVVEVDLVSNSEGVVWCDGRRTFDVAPGCRVVARRAPHHLTMVRLSEQPFTNRLVRKFGLRVEGWRSAPGSA